MMMMMMMMMMMKLESLVNIVQSKYASNIIFKILYFGCKDCKVFYWDILRRYMPWELLFRGNHPAYFSEVVHFMANWVHRWSRLSSSRWRPVRVKASVQEVYRWYGSPCFGFFSSCWVWWTFILPRHTGHAYSTIGLTQILNPPQVLQSASNGWVYTICDCS